VPAVRRGRGGRPPRRACSTACRLYGRSPSSPSRQRFRLSAAPSTAAAGTSTAARAPTAPPRPLPRPRPPPPPARPDRKLAAASLRGRVFFVATAAGATGGVPARDGVPPRGGATGGVPPRAAAPAAAPAPPLPAAGGVGARLAPGAGPAALLAGAAPGFGDPAAPPGPAVSALSRAAGEGARGRPGGGVDAGRRGGARPAGRAAAAGGVRPRSGAAAAFTAAHSTRTASEAARRARAGRRGASALPDSHVHHSCDLTKAVHGEHRMPGQLCVVWPLQRAHGLTHGWQARRTGAAGLWRGLQAQQLALLQLPLGLLAALACAQSLHLVQLSLPQQGAGTGERRALLSWDAQCLWSQCDDT